MKKYFLSRLVILFAGFVLTTCEDNDKFIPTGTPSVFHFTQASISVDEATLDKDGELDKVNTIKLTVMWSKHHPTAGNITLDVVPVTQIGGNPVVPAIEGEDYTISTKSLSFNGEGEGMYEQSFTITTMYDPTFTGSKIFDVKIVSSDVSDARLGATGASGSVRVTIGDVNHPLVSLIGNVKLKATRYIDGPVEVNSVIAPDPDDTEILWLYTNFRSDAINMPLKLNVKDLGDEFEVSIKLPQKAGDWSSTMTAMWFATYWIDAEDDWDITYGDHTIIGKTPKNKTNIEFDGAFALMVTYNDDGRVAGYVGGVNYLIPHTLFIYKD